MMARNANVDWHLSVRVPQYGAAQIRNLEKTSLCDLCGTWRLCVNSLGYSINKRLQTISRKDAKYRKDRKGPTCHQPAFVMYRLHWQANDYCTS
jgi:hypothetical protein